MNTHSRYVWWPSRRSAVFELADPRGAAVHLIAMVAITAILCLPAVAHATGISAPSIIGLIGLHIVWYVAGTFVIVRDPLTLARENVLLAGNLIVNIGIAAAIPVMTRDPKSPLWMLPVLYACLNGALQERERCIAFLLAHALSPLVALIPLLAGAPATSWSVAAPLLCAALCAVGYNHLASNAMRWRQVRAQQTAALTALRAEIREADRKRLMADVRDSIGSTLSVVGMYGELIHRHLDQPDELRAVAAMVRDTAHRGLGDLRGMIGAMAPAGADVAGLGNTLQQVAARAAEGRELRVVVSIGEGGTTPVAAPIRMAVVRAVQEAIRQAPRAESARRVDVRLTADAASITLELTDDAIHAAADDDRTAERVRDLGGTFSRSSAPASGTRIQVSLPHSQTVA